MELRTCYANLSWIWRLGEETIAVVDYIVFVVVQFSE